MSTLADRVRAVLQTPAREEELNPSPVPVRTEIRSTGDLEDILGGEWRSAGGGSCFVVESRVDRSEAHGDETVGSFADRLTESSDGASLLAGEGSGAPFLFFDLETTGLNGGAGTYAFLVGYGWFEEDRSFATRQFLVVRFGDERSMLGSIAGDLAKAGTLVSFNGRSFDAPLLESRFLYHRLEWGGRQAPHLDMVHIARRFWKRPDARSNWPADSYVGSVVKRTKGGNAAADSYGGAAMRPEPGSGAGDSNAVSAFSPTDRGSGAGESDAGSAFRRAERGRRANADDSSCSLASLERQLLGHRRRADVPGFEIPGRYFQFVRTGDARPLAAVLAHNRLDLLSLAALTARALHLIRIGPDAAREPREALALGRVYVEAGHERRAQLAYERAVDLAMRRSSADVMVDALRGLAIVFRRARRFDDAARCWCRLLEIRGCSEGAARMANEALAIHHEHRVRDFVAARTFAVRSLESGGRSGWADAVRHRLARIDKKLKTVTPEISRLQFGEAPDVDVR